MPRRHRLAKTRPESDKETQSVRQAQTGTKRTKRHGDANRSPEKPRKAQGNPERPSKLRLSDEP